MISMIMNTQFGMGINAVGVSLDQSYELRAGALMNVWCELGGFAGRSNSPDLSCWDMRNDRSYPTVFDFRFKRESDRSDPDILIEGSRCCLCPSNVVSMRLELVEIKVVAQPNLSVDKPSQFISLRYRPAGCVGDNGMVSEQGQRAIEVASALRFDQGMNKRGRIALRASCNTRPLARQQGGCEPHRPNPHGSPSLWSSYGDQR